MEEKVQQILQSLDPSSLRLDAGQFAAKLSMEERCGILAAYLSGVNRRILAVAFRINRRTVTHIYNPNSPHYNEVKKELFRMGKEEFVTRYFTESIAMRIKQAESDATAQKYAGMTDKEVSEHPVGLIKPSQRRKAHEGYHTIKPDWCAYSHRIQVAWVAGHFGDGWYYKDLDGSFPDTWMHSGEESTISSTAALKGAEENVMDKL